MKKVIAMLITALMVLTFSIPAAAAADTAEKGTITINDAKTGNEYTIYKILDLESYDVAAGTYAYKLTNDAWEAFFTGAGAAYVEISDKGEYVTWKGDKSEARRAEFAKLALAYAIDQKIAHVAKIKCTADGDVVINDLALGYYLVDSSMGALCGLTTTNPNAYITAKNGVPTIVKQVKEDLGETWGKRNTADIGQTVEFRAEIKVHAGAQNYIMHDKMSEGFDDSTIAVTKIVHLTSSNVTTTYENDDIATIATFKPTGTDECSFELVFKQDFCDTLKTNDWIYVYYQAELNEKAVIGLDGNPNEVWLQFGETYYTVHDKTTTFTYGFDIIKTDASNKLIDGAVFEIYPSEESENAIKVVPHKYKEDNSRVIEYRLANAEEISSEVAGLTTQIPVENGAVRIVGFDNGDYFLEEIEAPDGYNKLTDRVKFTISDNNLFATFSAGDIYSVNSGVQIVNNAGTMLPETGGMGTMIFVLIGGIAVLGAGIVLFARRRVSQYE